jgi:hypothetical protein
MPVGPATPQASVVPIAFQQPQQQPPPPPPPPPQVDPNTAQPLPQAPQMPVPTYPPQAQPAPTPVLPPPQAQPAPPPPPVVVPPAAPKKSPPVLLQPRSSREFELKPILLDNGEKAYVVSGGVVVSVGDPKVKATYVEMEADYVVFWMSGKGNPQRLLQVSDEDGPAQTEQDRPNEFFLAGNVEIRQATVKTTLVNGAPRDAVESHVIRANEVYYDTKRSVALALQADLELEQATVPDPLHLRGPEIQQLSPDQFKVIRSEVFASKLPSDPELKVFVAHGTVEKRRVIRRTIFGIPFVDKETGGPEFVDQQLFKGTNVVFSLEDIPVFWLPYVQGDANDPLGPFRNFGFGYNRVYGFQFYTTWNLYDLLGVQPIPYTHLHYFLDYLTARGPGTGISFDYNGADLFGIPGRHAATVNAYTIYDTGPDIIGGPRGDPYVPHQSWRGRFTPKLNMQDMPDGFSAQIRGSYISDMNYLEQFFQREWITDPNQETSIYLKQQQGNWAWSVLTEARTRNWITETNWLPKADGYLIGQSFFDLFTYSAHASAGYGVLQPTDRFAYAFEITDQYDQTGRLDLMQQVDLPLSLGFLKLVPYGVFDLAYYSRDLEGDQRGRVYFGGGARANIPLSRLYPEAQSELLNVNGIFHKMEFNANFYAAHSNTPYTLLPQLDRLNDDASDQAVRDLHPYLPQVNPNNIAILSSPYTDPQLYAVRRLFLNNVDTLDTVEALQLDWRQRWQTKRGYPGQQHVVDWLTLDLSATYFPEPDRVNFGKNWAFLEYDLVWNVGDRTAIVSSGWYDPIPDGARVTSVGVYTSRPDNTSFSLSYRQIDPLLSKAVTASINYIFSPKYMLTATATYDFGINVETTSLYLTRTGSDLQMSFGLTYNSVLTTVGFTFMLVPNLLPANLRSPGTGGFGTSTFASGR